MKTNTAPLISTSRPASLFTWLGLGCLLLLSSLVPAAHGANTFTGTGSLTTARYGHTTTLLPNGKVLVAGGWDTFSLNIRNTAELCWRAIPRTKPPFAVSWKRSPHASARPGEYGS